MLQTIFRFRKQDLAASLKSIWERDKVKFLCCLKIAFMLFSGNLSKNIFRVVINTYFCVRSCITFSLFEF